MDGNVEKSLEGLVGTFKRCEKILEHYTSETGEETLTAEINCAIEQMNQLVAAATPKEGQEPFLIPMKLFHFLDEGKNPESYVKESLEQCLQKRKQSSQKVEVFSAFRDQIAADFERAFPEDYKMFISEAGDDNRIGKKRDDHFSDSEASPVVSEEPKPTIPSAPSSLSVQTTEKKPQPVADYVMVDVDDTSRVSGPRASDSNTMEDDVVVEIEEGSTNTAEVPVDINFEDSTK